MTRKTDFSKLTINELLKHDTSIYLTGNKEELAKWAEEKRRREQLAQVNLLHLASIYVQWFYTNKEERKTLGGFCEAIDMDCDLFEPAMMSILSMMTAAIRTSAFLTQDALWEGKPVPEILYTEDLFILKSTGQNKE